MPTPRSHVPSALWPDLERMWTETTLSPLQIVEYANTTHGSAITVQRLEWHAQRRGWTRDLCARRLQNRSAREDRLFVASITRSGAGKLDDNRVSPVKPGTYPANGFRMGMSQE